MTSREIRTSFLKYFERNGHRIVPSSSLVPQDDPTLLFTNAGMNQFKDVFLGKERRDYVRATTSQKCMRVSGKHNDLDNVGPSLRHHTFFEMLGNFSFGDYFKKDAIAFAWELLTDVWMLPADRLYPTVFDGEGGIPWDEEAYGRWTDFVPEERITKLGLAENFWAMGETGPCGRCSEVHYFRGSHLPCPEPVCQGLSCSCDRYVEIWNNVFMEFERQAGGTLVPLPAPSIDTGMGLERIAAVIQGKLSNYDTDLFQPVLRAIENITGQKYGASAGAEGKAAPYDRRDSAGRAGFSTDDSMRVIADHARATTFLIADGVLPSNEWRGYVLRKIMRRAMRHGKLLGLTDPFLHRVVDTIVDEMGDQYPELRGGRDAVVQVVRSEEERFDVVLNQGLPRLEAVLAQAAAGDRRVPGVEMFRLYDTFGMPLDFIEDLANQKQLAIDREGFDRAMEGQREKARAGAAFETKAGQEFSYTSDAVRDQLRSVGDQFEGYTTTRVPGTVIQALFDENRRQVEALAAGQCGFVVVARTPFYVEAGGQVSDTGRIFSEAGGGSAAVEGMTRLNPGGPRAHRVHVTVGTLRPRDIVTAEVDAGLRDATRRNHTATHLVHAALRQVLGSHVKQAGSLVEPERLRFDFVHFAPLTGDQRREIERIVNEQIYHNSPVLTEVRPTQEAIAAGAMALFGEKYGDRVRVVSVPGFSLELCGGTHCRATGDIGFFTIVQEGGVAAGVRRIEALTGAGAVRYYQRRDDALDEVVAALNVPDHQAAEAVQRLQAEVRRAAREASDLRMKVAMGGGSGATADDVEEIGGVRVIARQVPGLDKTGLRTLADSLKDRLRAGVVILASAGEGKVAIVVAVSKDLTSRVSAGQVVRQIAPIVGGGGGGRADFAEAGGKDPSRVPEMLAESRKVVAGLLG
jgi:alanyl-tRNA synthetase